MNFFKKFKLLFTNNDNDVSPPPSHPTPTQTSDNVGDAHLSAISNKVKAWLDQREWYYHHDPASDDDELRTHHFLIGFNNDEFSWHCIFRIREKNQLVSLFGILKDSVPSSHYLNILYRVSQSNTQRGFGGLELDTTTGEVRAVMHFDAEFTLINQRMLDTYMHGLASLVEHLYDMVTQELSNPPKDSLSALIQQDTQNDSTDTLAPYFTPTNTTQ